MELQSTAAGTHVSRGHRRLLRRSIQRTDSDESLEDGSSLVPKEEGMVYCISVV